MTKIKQVVFEDFPLANSLRKLAAFPVIEGLGKDARSFFSRELFKLLLQGSPCPVIRLTVRAYEMSVVCKVCMFEERVSMALLTTQRCFVLPITHVNSLSGSAD